MIDKKRMATTKVGWPVLGAAVTTIIFLLLGLVHINPNTTVQELVTIAMTYVFGILSPSVHPPTDPNVHGQ